MRYATVCSGIEAPSVAWHPLGWLPVFFSEIEPFPCAVLKQHYPDVPNHGDMTQFKDWPDYELDLICGGTPCQSFSVAGLRKGLADPRGNLMLTFGAIADRYRPAWLVWENVPGVLSSNGGRDFGTFLGMLGKLGYGFAYRILDAQFCGVPQRRRRVFVVGYLGDWRRAAAVLFERHSLQGHPAPRRETRQSVAPTISARTKGGGGLGTDFDCDGGLIPSVCPTLRAGGNKTGGDRPPGTDVDTCDSLIPQIVGQAMSAKWSKGTAGPAGDEHHNLLAVPVAGAICKDSFSGGAGGRPEGAAAGHFIAHSLRGEGFDASEDGTGRGTPLVPVAFDLAQITSKANRTRVSPELPVSTLNAAGQMHCATTMQVRRLTPRECERLQGFPDDYTKIPLRNVKGLLNGKWAKNGPRYKALGNSMAVPVVSWIGERIALVDARFVKAAA